MQISLDKKNILKYGAFKIFVDLFIYYIYNLFAEKKIQALDSLENLKVRQQNNKILNR